MANALIICIGNVARGDDGVAHAVGSRLSATTMDGVVVLSAVDLDVAMAFDVAHADLFVVVDAQRRTEPPVVIEPIPIGSSGRATGHGMDAPTLLALASSLYDRAPSRALIVSVAAPVMGHGVGLSPVAEAACEEATSVVIDVIAAEPHA
ncbi:MAG: hypothetical protein CVT67_10000 [Actinobacteria bacterium HGW-Actinobacteria-7]|jgi:hydrogenase maturation protease|nr:MAG: hypothetical protein CVT67_10000 [Actinobacteria bacterium HGW-Actinobacteria-7]